MRLFHFSEDAGIRRFEPHVPATNRTEPPLVRAIDEAHQAHYLFPRDCPRVCFWRGLSTLKEDAESLLSASASGKVIAFEAAWLERIRTTELYRYEMPPESFVPKDRCGGYYVSESAVSPRAVEPVGDLLSALVASEAEIRVVPSLLPLRDTLVASSVEFSMIRLRNAGAPSRTPPERRNAALMNGRLPNG